MIEFCPDVIRRAAVSFILLFILRPVGAQDIQYAKQIITTLCSEQMHGRGYAKNGDKTAAAFIRKEFRKNGLEPLLDNFFQSFPVTANTFPGPVKINIKNKQLVPGMEFIVHPSSPGVKGEYMLYTINAQELVGLDSLPVLPTDHKSFFLIDNRRDQDLDPHAKEQLSRKISLIQNSLSSNTAGVIELTSESLSWGVSADVYLKPFIKINFPVDPDTLNHIYINLKNKYKEKYTTKNIAGYISGTECPDSFIVFTAHYDHIGIMGAYTRFPGAHDNASGVAMLLYISKYFQLNPPKISIVFLSFSAEELGLIGSSYFVNHSTIDLKKIKFLVNFDMVGTGKEGIKIVNGTIYPEKFQLLTEMNNRYNLLTEISVRGATCISDHCPFDYAGVPSFYIYTVGESPEYHSINDNPESLCLTGFEGLARLMIDFVNTF